MKIDGNETEKRSMAASRAGDKQEAARIQEEFLAEFREAKNNNVDHCSCAKACRYHGNCLECVTIHRGHQDHLPNCFHPMVNQRLRAVSELTEHSIALDVTPPDAPSVK